MCTQNTSHRDGEDLWIGKVHSERELDRLSAIHIRRYHYGDVSGAWAQGAEMVVEGNTHSLH